MASSTCIKCGNNSFEVVKKTASGSKFEYNFVQCNQCGGVVGVLDCYNIGTLILELAEKYLIPLESKLENILE